ncbi:MAG: 5'-phosphate synthase pdxT subunit [Rhodothermales bacterium]|jgi:5'-phosphate synthase pdxT subunit
MTVGILGLQGCVRPHLSHFETLGVQARRILFPADLECLRGLVIPGGESSTMLKTAPPDLWPAVAEFADTYPVWGICAGSILLAREVENPAQDSLGLLDISVRRNAYGAQNESFCTTLDLEFPTPASGRFLFIRAPRITRVGEGLDVLARHEDTPVMVAGERHMATTFHPELSDDPVIHAHFLSRL